MKEGHIPDVALSWLKECISQHPKCQNGVEDNPQLPSHILDVRPSNGNCIRLRETTDGERGYYVALSHCWGDSPQFTTISGNLEDRKTSIAENDMPATFRDAVAVTRFLGFDLLWIDSLCIIQDDVTDWERESSMMKALFSNATVTIAASRAAADSEGFLGPRTLGSIARIPPSFDGERPFYFVQEYSNLAGYANIHGTAKGPLQSRAWTMQETLLARRKLMFGPSQVIWDCKSHACSQTGVQDWPSVAPVQALLDRTFEHRDVVSLKPKQYDIWFDPVENYKQRDLTKPSDVFPALSGIAEMAGDVLKDTYLAGIWAGKVIHGLVWKKRRFEYLRRPELYRAPSWSWASTHGPVRFPARQRFWSRESETELAQVVEHQINI
jgi:hypothetical protein